MLLISISLELPQVVLNHIILNCVSCLRSKHSSNDYNQYNWHANLLFKIVYCISPMIVLTSNLMTLPWHANGWIFCSHQNFGISFLKLMMVSSSYLCWGVHSWLLCMLSAKCPWHRPYGLLLTLTGSWCSMEVYLFGFHHWSSDIFQKFWR